MCAKTIRDEQAMCWRALHTALVPPAMCHTGGNCAAFINNAGGNVFLAV